MKFFARSPRLFLPLFALALFSLISVSKPALAVDSLSDKKSSAITQFCPTTRQTLKSIQKSDAYTRSHLGHSYETLISDYLTPLNLALVKLNRPDSTLSKLQISFVSARAKFNEDYITYSKSLEELIAIDCASVPEIFYAKLESVRSLRQTVASDVASLNKIISSHKKAVESLKGSL